MEKYTIEEAVNLALEDARNMISDGNEYRIEGVAPMTVGLYLEEILGFDCDDSDYNSVWDSVFSTYSKDDICIVLGWNGWTGYVSVMGYSIANYYGNVDC